MKKILVSVFAFALLAAPFAQADMMSDIQQSQIKRLAKQAKDGDILGWTVGDEADYQMTVAQLGDFAIGTMTETVTQDTGDGYWMSEVMAISILGQNMETDVLFSKADGSIQEIKVNGQDQTIPTETVTIVSQDYESVTVPAGTFNTLHVVASETDSTGAATQIEEWANPKDIVIAGTAKSIEPISIAGQNVSLTMELTAQTHGSGSQ